MPMGHRCTTLTSSNRSCLMNVHLIAEIGSNWWRGDEAESKKALLKSVSAAAECGATAVKLQLWDAEKLYSAERAPDLLERARRFEVPLGWLPTVKAQAEGAGLELWASVFDADTARATVPWLDCVKLASGDLTNYNLVKYVSWLSEKHGVPLAVSTGAATMEEISDALTWLAWDEQYRRLTKVPSLYLFHCISAYPAPIIDLNLRAGLQWLNGVDALGLSDHTLGYLGAQLALAAGYTMFEKHFKLDDTPDECPDCSFALPPARFRGYADALATAWVVMGDDEKRPAPSEEGEREWARRGSDGLRPRETADEE